MYFAPATHPSLHGTLIQDETTEQEVLIDQYFQKHYGDYTCSHVFFGRDEKFIYVDMMCGTFEIKKDELVMNSGHHMYRRIEYKNSPFRITGFTDPADGSFHAKSIIRMFPETVYKAHIQHAASNRTDMTLLSKIRVRLENP